MSNLEAFSADYVSARERFRKLAAVLGWQLESHSIGVSGPRGEDLTLDVACSPQAVHTQAIVVSSGVHGVEGFFGSAVQVALLEQWRRQPPPALNIILLHAVNPFGFAWLRRCDENNVDLNRNFLLPDESYAGAPAFYAQLDSLLNPKHPPSLWEPFMLRALCAVARHGMPALKQAIASGQYEFPQGLFFGGSGPTRSHALLKEILGRLLRGRRQVVHLDLHTGLGKSGASKLLIDYQLSQSQRSQLVQWFGPAAFEVSAPEGVAYSARGGMGRWCNAQNFVPDYLYACAEFGTYNPIRILAGLRAENQAHHWATASASSRIKAKRRLKELFCPSAPTWRSKVLQAAIALVADASRGMTD